jgi:hypothetical protein
VHAFFALVGEVPVFLRRVDNGKRSEHAPFNGAKIEKAYSCRSHIAPFASPVCNER